jgi:hypothetical protein
MKRTWRLPLAGFVFGALVGATVLTVNVVGASAPGTPRVVTRDFGEILHTPALLARAGEPVELSYDVVCGALEDRPGGSGCSPKGSVFVRPVGATKFAVFRLERESDGLFSAEVPAGLARGGFDYYVRIDNGRGQVASLPKGAATAPQHVWPLEKWTTVDLGPTGFGLTKAPSSAAATFTWGKGDRSVGLDSGREQSRIGPSAFDVAPDGSLVVLDQVNRRLVIVRDPDGIKWPIPFTGGEGDLSVGRDGTIAVLDAGGKRPVVSTYTATGQPIAGTMLAERVADMVRSGPDGPVVHAYPSEMWLPTGSGRPPLAPAQQVARAEPSREIADGLGVVVRAGASEAGLALVRGDRVVHAWIVRASANLGEVQLAEPYRDGLLVVLRVWNEKHAAFRVLRLAPHGLASSFAVERAEWAETASLSRFRLHGDTLYQLRSSPTGVVIARFEIGGMR